MCAELKQMELGLSLGASKPFSFMEKPREEAFKHVDLGLNTTLSIGPISSSTSCNHHQQEEGKEEEAKKEEESYSTIREDEATNKISTASLSSPKANNNYLQLDLLPHTPLVPLSSFSWPPPSENADEVAASSRGLNVKRLPEEDESEERSSPISGASSFQMDLCIYSKGGSTMSGSGNNNNGKRDSESEAYYDQRACSRASDEDDNVGVRVGTRKKLRLSKEQSAFLEESFKEHSTLNPKQKLALAKQLDLRPRQVEVWFQNRRARTKLKQTEVDCEYLKRCCETLSEENRRLQKELQELRALKASNSNPFFMQLPATTLTMCPSCERVASNPVSTSSSSFPSTTSKAIGFPLGKPKFYPFAHSKPHQS